MAFMSLSTILNHNADFLIMICLEIPISLRKHYLKMRLLKGFSTTVFLLPIFKTFVNGHQETVSKVGSIPLLCALSPILAPPPPTKMPIIGQ